jgi:hypothetical protein
MRAAPLRQRELLVADLLGIVEPDHRLARGTFESAATAEGDGSASR